MAIEVDVLDKYETSHNLQAEISYTCPHCGETVTDLIAFSKCLNNHFVDVDDQDCPVCGESNDLEVDLT
ncbi:MAG: CPXCG motif-containing cysteine-rich protein [Clostridia bacterium]|nr:CPXCG motif-containing cysteine-rich protein [Clostridia bacterium]